jgi:aarF domain-containing kinase
VKLSIFLKMRKFSFASIAKLSKRSLQSKRSFVPLALKGAGLVCTFAIVGEPSLSSISACDAAQVHTEPKEEILSVITNEKSEDANKAKEVIQLIRKMLVYLQRIFAYVVLGVPVVCVGSTAYALGGVAPIFEDAVWDYCMWSIQLLGPTFVKLAQWASTRPDLYPPALIQRLESLQDNVKVNYSMDTVERTLAGAFGPDWKDIIEVEGQPLGAGCVAQVFKGTLKESSANESQKIAIKLIHPHVEKMIQTDMELLGIFANFIDRFPSLEILSLGDTCREYCKMMNAQLDLRLEAYNLTEFSSKFADEPWAAFPVPIDGLVTRNVLVETLMEGSSIANFMRMKVLTLHILLLDLYGLFPSIH